MPDWDTDIIVCYFRVRSRSEAFKCFNKFLVTTDYSGVPFILASNGI